MDLDATPYRCFVTVAEQKSFTRASEVLNISQPALSAAIRELERRLGFALFTRTSRRVDLTTEGRLFLGNAQRVVTEAASANRAAREILGNDLRIGAPFYTLHIQERRALIDRLIVDHPAIRLRIFNRSHARHYADLLSREIDLALLVEPSDVTSAAIDVGSDVDWPEGLERLCVAERRLALQIPIEHPWAQMGIVPIAALKQQRIASIDRSLGVPLTVAIGRALREAGAEAVRPPEGHALAVERFGRLARIPAIMLGWFDPLQSEASSDVVVRQVEGLNLRTSLSLIRLHGEQRAAAALVWNMMKAATNARQADLPVSTQPSD